MYTHVYFVYHNEREKVFQSQVLTFLKIVKENSGNKVLLVLFKRPQSNLDEIIQLIGKYNLNNYFLIFDLNLIDYFINHYNILKRITDEITQHVDVSKPTLFHCRGHVATLFAVGIKSKLSNQCIKILFDNRGLPLEENINFSLITYIKGILHRKILRHSQKWCDIYSFVSTEMREFHIKRYGYNGNKPYIIVPTCVDAADIPPFKKSESGRTYIYTGTTYYWQNVDETIKLFCKIQSLDSSSNFILLVDNVDKVKSICLSYGLKAEVDEVEHKLVLGYLAKSSVGLILRDNSIINKVAAPTKLSEYISCGLKVIYSGELGSLKDFITNENAEEYKDELFFNIDCENIDEIVKKIKGAAPGDKVFRYFLWQTHINKYKELLEDAI